jgi:phosphoglycerate dehydrogenase-like enzyme
MEQDHCMHKIKLLVIGPPGHPSLRALDRLKDAAEIAVGDTPEFVKEHAADAEVVLYTGLESKTLPFEEIWPYLTSIKWVHSLSAGVEKYMTPAFVESPVPLTNARGVFKRSLADFAILGILYFTKKVRRLVESQRAHKWDSFGVGWVPDKVVGIVGYGEIGQECGRLAKALGMKVHAVRRNPERSQNDPLLERVFPSERLHEMLREVDVLIAAAPLTQHTRHMLSDAEFGAMKSSAIVINVGRGPVVDEAALIRALESKTIAGAALDVFEEEPVPPTSPLWDMENVLISPHCTDRTENPDWQELSVRLFLQNFERYRKGEPLLNVVDKKAGY